eukprot:tig00000073_g1712.t1
MGASVSISESQIAGLQTTGNAVCASFEKEYLAAFRRSIWNLFKETASNPDRLKFKVTQLSKGPKTPSRLGCKVLSVEDAGEDRDGNVKRMYTLEVSYGDAAAAKKLRRSDGEMRDLSSQFAAKGAPPVRSHKKDDGDRQRQSVEALLDFMCKDQGMLAEQAVQEFFAIERSALFSRCARAAVAKAIQERQRLIHGQPLPNALSQRGEPADPTNLDTEPRMLMAIVSDTLVRTAVPAIEKKTGKGLKPKHVRDIKRQMSAAAQPQVDGTWGRVSSQVKGVQGQLMGGGASTIAMMAEAEGKGRQVLQPAVERMLRPSLQTLEGAMIPEVLQEMAEALARPFGAALAAGAGPKPAGSIVVPPSAIARPRPLPARLADIVAVATSPMGQGAPAAAGPLVSEIVAECRAALTNAERALEELLPTAERIDSALGPEAITGASKTLRRVAAAVNSYLGGGVQPLSTALEGVLRAIESGVTAALAGGAGRAGEAMRREAAAAIEESEGRLTRWGESCADGVQEALQQAGVEEQTVSATVRRLPALRSVMTTALATLADHAARTLPARLSEGAPAPVGAGAMLQPPSPLDADRASITGSAPRSEGARVGGIGGIGGPGGAQSAEDRKRGGKVLENLLATSVAAAHAVAAQRLASWAIDVASAVYAAVLLPEFDEKVLPIMERDGMLAPADEALPAGVRPAVDAGVLAREFIADRVALSASGSLKRVAALLSDKLVQGEADGARFPMGGAVAGNGVVPGLKAGGRKATTFARGDVERGGYDERPVLFDLESPPAEPEAKPKGFLDRLTESLACCSAKPGPGGRPAPQQKNCLDALYGGDEWDDEPAPAAAQAAPAQAAPAAPAPAYSATGFHPAAPSRRGPPSTSSRR